LALATYFQPKFEQNHLGKKLANLSTDTLVWGLIASGALAARGTTQGYEFVSDLLANGGSALTEVSTSGTGYTRQNAASVSYTVSGLVVTLTTATPLWNPVTLTAVYAWLHDETASSGTDATRPLIGIMDLGGSFSPSGQAFSLTPNASGIFTWTANP
jgi:hypothetical protein